MLNQVFIRGRKFRPEGYFCPVKILITIYGPTHSAKLINIYEPCWVDDQTISFLIDVDGVYATFLLKNEGVWKRKGSNGKYTRKTIQIIQEAIASYYISGLFWIFCFIF